MLKIVADNKIPFLKGALEPFAEVVYLAGNKITKADLIDADALITRTRTKCNQQLLEGTKVKFIATATIGYDHIDTKWCEENGISWTNAPGCNSGSVMQFIGSALVFLSRKHNFKLSDKTLGVVGVGNVGSKVVKVAQALGMRVLKNDPPKVELEKCEGYVSIQEIQEQCDIITFHVPLTRTGNYSTFHLVNDEFINKTLPNVFIINSSRGEVVDGNSLKAALKSSKVMGAGLDVWENEPNLDEELLSILDISTPHIAGYSADGKANGTSMSVQAIARFFALEATNWQPQEIPMVDSLAIEIDNHYKTTSEIVAEAIYHTYSIEKESVWLKNEVKDFERYRGDYPIRREFLAYQIKLKEKNEIAETALKSVGFRII